MKNKYLTAFIVIVIITGLYILGNYLFTPKFGQDPENPYDLKLDDIGQINKNRYCSYNSSKIEIGLNDPRAVGIDKQDNIYVSGDNKVKVFNQNGTFQYEFPTPKTATALTFSDDGMVYLGIRDHIEVFDKTGKLISSWDKLKGNAYITSIVVIKDDIFIAEAEAEVVYKTDKKGNIKDIYGDSVPANSMLRFVLPSYYFDVAKDPDGFLWIANTGKHKLINLNDKGDMRSYWGESSSEIEGFCGCCNPTHFTFLEDGSFITSEKGIVRIKKYNNAGKFVCAVAGPEHFKKGSEGLDVAVNSIQYIYVLEPKAKVLHVFKENQ